MDLLYESELGPLVKITGQCVFLPISLLLNGFIHELCLVMVISTIIKVIVLLDRGKTFMLNKQTDFVSYFG